MIDYNYESELACEMLRAHHQFMESNGLYRDPDQIITDAKLENLVLEAQATEATIALMNSHSEKNRPLFQVNVSTQFIMVQALRAVRTATRNLMDQMQESVRSHLDKVLIPLGQHSSKCKDTNGICTFIKEHEKDILKIQKDISKELSYFKKLSTDTEKYKGRYQDLEKQLDNVIVAYRQWIDKPKSEVVEIQSIKLTLRNYDTMIKNLHDCEAQLAIIENDYRGAQKINSDIVAKTDALLNIINKTIQFLIVLSNALKGSFSPLSRISSDGANHKILNQIKPQYSSTPPNTSFNPPPVSKVLS